MDTGSAAYAFLSRTGTQAIARQLPTQWQPYGVPTTPRHTQIAHQLPELVLVVLPVGKDGLALGAVRLLHVRLDKSLELLFACLGDDTLAGNDLSVHLRGTGRGQWQENKLGGVLDTELMCEYKKQSMAIYHPTRLAHATNPLSAVH